MLADSYCSISRISQLFISYKTLSARLSVVEPNHVISNIATHPGCSYPQSYQSGLLCLMWGPRCQIAVACSFRLPLIVPDMVFGHKSVD